MDLRVDEDALRALGVELVVLFGSHARGTSGPESDVDVGVVTQGEVPPLMDARRGRIQDALGFDGEIDLVFLAEADPLLLFQVATDGKPLYERAPGTFEEFRIRAVKLYYDTAWIRRIEAEALRRRYA
ncbi:MAG: nucleotidyltransferase domain-containing protein [Actinomycetota bacterium]